MLWNAIDQSINRTCKYPLMLHAPTVSLCFPFLCVTFLQSSNLKRNHSKLLKASVTYTHIICYADLFFYFLLPTNFQFIAFNRSSISLRISFLRFAFVITSLETSSKDFSRTRTLFLLSCFMKKTPLNLWYRLAGKNSSGV